MKATTRLIGLLLLFLASPAKIQPDGDGIPWFINNGTMVGIGGYSLMDTYLSSNMEDKKYTDSGLQVMNERVKEVRPANYQVSKQQIINIDLASTDNATSTATDFAGFINYTLGYCYHLPTVLLGLKLSVGGTAHGVGGFIHNTRNGSNPASAKADIDLSIFTMAIYKLRVREYPMTLRYQFTISFTGVLFPPHYRQLYYKVFNLGNASGVVQLNLFHNKFTVKNLFMVDFPARNFTIRAGYLNSSYHTDVNGMQSHMVSHSSTISLVKEFISFRGEHLKNIQRFRSAYY